MIKGIAKSFGEERQKQLCGIVFLIAIGSGLLLHLLGIGKPFLGNFAQHQTDYATVVSNFIERGINPFLPVMKFIAMGKERLFLGDLPLTMTITAVLCRITSLPVEFCGRSLSAIFFFLSLYPFYRLSVRFTKDRQSAVYALLFYVFSPLTIIYGQSFLLEMPALFFLITSLYLLFKWDNSPNDAALVLSALFASFAIALRVYFAFFLIPVGYIFLSRYRASIFVKRQPYVYLALALSLMVLWQLYAGYAARRYGVLTSMEDNLVVFNVTRNFPDRLMFNPETYKAWLDTFTSQVVTPVGILAAILGISSLASREVRFFFVYMTVFFGLFFIAPRKFYEFNYYFMPLVPVMSIMAGAGVAKALKNAKNILVVTIGILGFVAILSLRHSFAPAFITPKEDKNVLEAAHAVREIAPKASRVIASHGSSSSFLYYCNRSGWAFDVSDSLTGTVRFSGDNSGNAVERLERLRAQGAEFFAITNQEDLKKNPSLLKHLTQHYPVAMEESGIAVFDLRQDRGQRTEMNT